MALFTVTPRVKRIVEEEWKRFDQVHNIGGRASCQDSPDTFFIMRSSQLMAWSKAMQESYWNDLITATQQGRNLLAEKYAYMMARTSPAEFSRIRSQLPARLPEKDTYIDAICAVSVAWQEQLAQQYPHLVGHGRAIRKETDSLYETSFETYLWGELATYSLDTVKLYDAYIQQLKAQGKSLCEMILKNTVQQLGYASLAEAEAKLAGGSS